MCLRHAVHGSYEYLVRVNTQNMRTLLLNLRALLL